MGPASGYAVNSYQAEGIVCLALLRFLHRVAKLTATAPSTYVGIIATDSLSLLNTLWGKEATFDAADDELPRNVEDVAYQAVTSKVTLDFMKGDWDVLKEIQENVKGLSQIQMQFVKGHQDDDTEYQELDQMAQLNVDADHMASRFQIEQGEARLFLPMMSRTCILLNMPQGTITRRYTTSIRRAFSDPPLRRYLQSKHHWSYAIFHQIDWDIHGQIMRKMHLSRMHNVRLFIISYPLIHS